MPNSVSSPAAVRRLLAWLTRVERGLCIAAFAVLVLVLFADVLSRELTAAGLYWAPQVGVWANVLVVAAGVGLASAAGVHLRPRFADSWLPRRWAPVLAVLQHACTALFCGAAGWLALLVVLESRRLGAVSLDLFLPIWPVQALLPAALFAAAIRHACYTFYPALRPAENSAFAQQAVPPRAEAGP